MEHPPEQIEENLRKAHHYVAMAAAHLCLAGYMEEAHDCQVMMDCIKLDHSELIQTSFPVVTKR